MITKGKQLRVLLLEDSVPDAYLVNEILSGIDEANREFSVLIYHAESVGEMHEMLYNDARKQEIDVALIDLGLPDSDGMETYRSVKDALRGTPIVIISGNENETLIVDLLREGAQDYLAKGDINRQSARLVLRTLVFAMERAELIREIRKQQAATDLAQIAGILKEACRVPCQKLALAVKMGFHRQNAIALERLLREAHDSSLAIAHAFESIHAASTELEEYDAMDVMRRFADVHGISLPNSGIKAPVTGCPHSLWSALEYLLAYHQRDSLSPRLMAEATGNSLSLEFRSGDDAQSVDDSSVEQTEEFFHEFSLDRATLRDLPVVYSSRLHGGTFQRCRDNSSSRLQLPLAN